MGCSFIARVVRLVQSLRVILLLSSKPVRVPQRHLGTEDLRQQEVGAIYLRRGCVQSSAMQCKGMSIAATARAKKLRFLEEVKMRSDAEGLQRELREVRAAKDSIASELRRANSEVKKLREVIGKQDEDIKILSAAVKRAADEVVRGKISDWNELVLDEEGDQERWSSSESDIFDEEGNHERDKATVRAVQKYFLAKSDADIAEGASSADRSCSG